MNLGVLFLVGTPRGMLKNFQAYLLDSDWSEVQEGIEVKLVNSPDGRDTFVLCRSADHREKEKAIHDRFAQRIEAGLGQLDKELKQARRKRDRTVLERRIGRLLGRNPRAAGGFKIELAEDKTSPAGLQLRWSRVEAWSRWTRLCCITQPDPAQRALPDRRGLVIPGRLGRPSWVRTPKL